MENLNQPKIDIQYRKPVIKVIGLGGGGGNAVMRMISKGFSDVEFIVANTDYQALQSCRGAQQVLLGPESSMGKGAGGNPINGEIAARESVPALRKVLSGADIVFLTAGMGGGTGSGAIPVAAEIAREEGAITISVVSTPFSFEAGRRIENANSALNKLAAYSDTMIAIPNDQLLKISPKSMTLKETFELADDVLRQGIQGMTHLLNGVGVINVDFAHIRSMLLNGRGSILSIGRGSGPDRVSQALQQALNHPLLERIPIENATGIIANFTGSENLGFGEIVDGMNYLQKLTNYRADLIPGQIIDPAIADDSVELILILTGIASTPLETRFEPCEKEPPKEVKPAPARKIETESIRNREVVIAPKKENETTPAFSYQTSGMVSVSKTESAKISDISPEADAAFSSLLSPLDLKADTKGPEADSLADAMIDTRRDLDVPTFIRRKL